MYKLHEIFKIIFWGSRKPTKKFAMKMKVKIKAQLHKYFVVEGGIYKAVSEDWWDWFRWTLGQWYYVYTVIIRKEWIQVKLMVHHA